MRTEGANYKPTTLFHQWFGVLEGNTINTTKDMDNANGMTTSSKTSHSAS
jgi:hypothetical protein